MKDSTSEIHYLPCEHCGFHNEVKSEYLVFCGRCNKKMENTFTRWKSSNPGKTFEDYKKLVCIRQKTDEQGNSTTRRPKQGLTAKYWMGVVIGAVFVVILTLVAKEVVRNYFFPSLKKYASGEWVMQDCGSLGLQIESPLELEVDQTIEEELGNETIHAISSIESFVGETPGNNLTIMANSIRYQPGIKSSLEGAVAGSLKEIQAQQGISNLKYDVSRTTHFDIQGRQITGKWKQGKDFFGFQQVIYVKKNVAWQVLIIYDLKDPHGEPIAERIIRSVKITPNIARLDFSQRPSVLPPVPGFPHQLSFR